jgi:hypothetical protein
MDGSITDIERNSDPGINAEVNNLVCRKGFDVRNIETSRTDEISESVTIKEIDGTKVILSTNSETGSGVECAEFVDKI